LITAKARINISKLKQFALNEISKDSPLYNVILCEPDEVDTVEFVSKLKIWLTLVRGKLL